MRAFGIRALGALAALGLLVPAAPLLISTSALAVECTNNGAGGGGSAGATDNDVASNTACGINAQATGANNSTAVGSDAAATGHHATAVGGDSVANDLDTTAIGYNAQATANGATAVGGGPGATNAAHASGENAVAIGGGSGDDASAHGANAEGNFSIAVGQGSDAAGTGSIAVGRNSSAMASSATAMGASASAAFYNSAAFGYGAAATRADQQVFGTSSNTYTMPGLTSAGSSAAQSGPLALVTTDQGGNMAADTGLYNQIGENQQGVAMAMALSNFWVPYGKSFAAGVSVGAWDGAWAIGANVGGQLADGVHVTGGIAISESGMVGGRAGGVFSW